MANITVYDRKAIKEQKMEMMREIRAGVPDVVDIERLKGNIMDLIDIREPNEINGRLVKREVSIKLKEKGYTEEDLIVLYYPEIKDMAVQDTVNNTLTYKLEDGMKQIKLPNGYKQAHIILAEAFLDKGRRGNQVRLIDENGSQTDLDNIEWFESDERVTKPKINVRETCKELKKEGLKLLQVGDYILVSDGRIITDKSSHFLTISSTRRDYYMSLPFGNKPIEAETVVKLASEYTWKEWNKLSDNEKEIKITTKEHKGKKEYTEKFHEDVEYELGRISKSEQLIRVESRKRKAERDIDRELKGLSSLDKVLLRLGNSNGVLITVDKNYVLIPNGQVVSVNRGQPLTPQGNSGDPAYLIYIDKKQRTIYARSIVNFMEELKKGEDLEGKGVKKLEDGRLVIGNKGLASLVGKRSKYYKVQ